MTEPSPDFPEYDGRTTPVWDELAEWWDDKIGDGNEFQDYLIEPATERLLQLKPGERVLDVACGAGRFARRMLTHGVTVLATDHSEKFIDRARERTTENMDRIEYRVMDAVDATALLKLGEKSFDAAVCTMALMDMSSIEPLISSLPRLLKPGGRFVFSLMHPAFQSDTAEIVVEEEAEKGETGYVKVTGYAQKSSYLGEGIHGQPVLQRYFHRPVSLLFNTCFRHGFVLDGLEEPVIPDEVARTGSSTRSQLRGTVPMVLVARMRLVSPAAG